MQKKLMKNLLIVLTMIVLCLAVGMTASAEEITGSCGDNATYTFNSETGIVTISGTGTIDRSFCSDEDIESVVISNGVSEIKASVFQYCDNIKNISIPGSVEIIEENCFDGCHNIDSFYVSENNLYYSSDEFGALFNKDKTVLIKYPQTSLCEKYTIPSTVRIIGSGAFECNTTLLEIIIPEGVEEIGIGVFHNCMNLRRIEFPSTLKHIPLIGEAMSALTTVTIENGTQSLGEMFLMYALTLESVYIKDIDVEIGDYFLYSDIYVSEDLREEYLDFMYNSFWVDEADISCFLYNDGNYYDQKFQSFLLPKESVPFNGTIYCHSGSTAEAYAIENGAPYVLTHFFEGDWTYDYDNMIRYRKCIHCDELETEALETTTDSDVEIIEPADPDTDFVVDVITDYVVIEETISNNVAGDFEIVKAFDITMKNKDGVHVQPDGTVKVKLPLDWSKDGVYKVYRVNDDGTLTDMNAYREGSHMVFETDHFSVYVIVDESEKADEPTTPDDPQEETRKDFFSKIIDWFRSLIDLIISWFKK